MHRASNISNIGQGTITIIVTNRGGQSNRKKVHSRLLISIRISLVLCGCKIIGTRVFIYLFIRREQNGTFIDRWRRATWINKLRKNINFTYFRQSTSKKVNKFSFSDLYKSTPSYFLGPTFIGIII